MPAAQVRQVQTQWTYSNSGIKQLTTAEVVQLPALTSGGPQRIVDNIVINNVTGGAVTVTVQLGQNGVAISGTLNDILTAYSIPANSPVTIQYGNGTGNGLVLGPLDLIQAKASANTSLNFLINYRTEQ